MSAPPRGGVRFLHTADWQLGMRRYYLGEEAQADFAAARLSAVERIVQLAADEECAFVVVCGDVFESNQVDPRTRVRALDAMGGAVPVYLLPGNHDPLDAASVYRSRSFEEHRPANVHLLDGTVTIRAGVELVGLPWRSKRPAADPIEAAYALEPEPGTLRIVAGHGQVDHGHPKPERIDLIRIARVESALAAGRFHYLALGDRHSAGPVAGNPRVWYSGTPEVTDFNEERPGYALRVEISGGEGEVQVEERSVGRWRFVGKSVELSGGESVEGLATWLAGLEDKRSTVVRLALGGQLALRDAARLDSVLELHGDLLAALDRAAGTRLTVLPDHLDRDRLALGGFARQALDELQGRAAEEGGGGELARDALALLYRLALEGAEDEPQLEAQPEAQP